MGRERQTIMLVDDNRASLTMGKNILKEKYEVYPIASGEKLFEILEKVSPDLILLDISMPGMDGHEVIRRLKASRKTQDIPVIFLTSRDDPGNELEGLSLGAIDYISKPFSPALLTQRIDNHLLLAFREKELEKINRHLRETGEEFSGQNREMMCASLGTLAEAAESRPRGPDGHNRRIRAYLALLLDELDSRGIYQSEAILWDKDILPVAAQLHDAGKLMVKESVLNKEEELSAGEFAEIKNHAAAGAELISRMFPEFRNHPFLNCAGVIAGSHHEKWDGSGYPLGLREMEIPLPGRLTALADGYDALVSPRPYRTAFGREETEKIIIAGKGTWLDPALVDIFIDAAPRFAEILGRKN